MALIVDREARVIEVQCEAPYCDAVLGVVVAGPDLLRPLVDLMAEVFDQADSVGWRLAGRTFCPAHVWNRPGRRTTVADGYAWADVRQESVKGPQERSDPLTGGRAN